MNTKTLTLIFFLVLSLTGIAQIMPYRQLPEFDLSTKYKVEIKQGGEPYVPVYTYQYPVNRDRLVTKTEHLSMFAFEPLSGKLQVRISMLDDQKLTASNFELVNKMHDDIKIEFKKGACILTIASAKKQLLLRSIYDKSQPLQLHVDPYQMTKIPTDAKVYTFEASNQPHVFKAEFDRFVIPNNIDVVVIEDGALIKGNLHTEEGRTKPLLLTGRGVILGNGPIVHGRKGIPYNSVELINGTGHTMEGLTIIKSRHFGLRATENATIDHVKIYGYIPNNDGVVAGNNSTITNCYFKVEDDHVKLYYDNMHVENCTFYAQNNGGIFQLAWNSIVPGNNCTVENCEVVEVEFLHCGDPAESMGGIARSFLSLRESSAGFKSENLVFKNIIIQGQLKRFIGINGKYGGSKPCTIKGITFENVEIKNKPDEKSWIYTGEPHSIDINFKNVNIAGKPIQKTEFKTEGKVLLEFNN